ncbi:MAG: hypothetical protein EBT51_06625 [Flavobacteriaceae bacterium]|nr:hypothetical protein [Flavobacteriaceae bacterium]
MPKTHIAHIGDDVCKVGMVEMERHLKSEADDNLARDPLAYRSAWLFGVSVRVTSLGCSKWPKLSLWLRG